MANYCFTASLREKIAHNLAALEPHRLDAEGLRHAAVGVVLVPDRQGRACFVLTRRLATLRRHRGQWALPGGRLEAGETEPEAALRDANRKFERRFRAIEQAPGFEAMPLDQKEALWAEAKKAQADSNA